MSTWIDNPALYRRLSEPHESIEEANSEVRQFFAAVSALREKHRIADMVLTCAINAMRDGEETAAFVGAYFGDRIKHEAMLARELGRVQGERQQHIAELLRAGAIMESKS